MKVNEVVMRKVSKHSYETRCVFQPGTTNNDIVLLLESPGDEELRLKSPLSGPTFLSYECIRAVIAAMGNYPLAVAMGKDQIRIANVWPEKISQLKRAQLIKEFTRDRREDVIGILERMIGSKSIVICAGELACVAYSKLVEKGRSSARTIVFLPYFGEQGLSKLLLPVLCARNRTVKKLELIGTFLGNYLMKEGLFGWQEMKQLWKDKRGEKIMWKGAEHGPDWMVPYKYQNLGKGSEDKDFKARRTVSDDQRTARGSGRIHQKL